MHSIKTSHWQLSNLCRVHPDLFWFPVLKPLANNTLPDLTGGRLSISFTQDLTKAMWNQKIVKESWCDLELKGDLVAFISKPELSRAFAIQQAWFGNLFYFLTMWTWVSFWPWTILQLWTSYVTSLDQMSAFEKLGIRSLLPLQGLVELNVKNFILSDHHSYCHGHIIFDVLMRMLEGLFSHMPFSRYIRYSLM